VAWVNLVWVAQHRTVRFKNNWAIAHVAAAQSRFFAGFFDKTEHTHVVTPFLKKKFAKRPNSDPSDGYQSESTCFLKAVT
jgi:aspartyl/asparaginyl-tRNA synthetase